MTFKRNARKPAFQQHGVQRCVQRCQANGKNLASKKSVKISWVDLWGHFPCSSYLSKSTVSWSTKNLPWTWVSKSSRVLSKPRSSSSFNSAKACRHVRNCSKDLKRSEKGLSQSNKSWKAIFRGFSKFASTWTISAARSESLKIYLHGATFIQKMWWTWRFHRIQATFLEALPWSPILSAGNVWRIPKKKNNDLRTSSLHVAQLKKKR